MVKVEPTPVALTIAGSDPSGGAGLQADLKTFHQHGVYGMSVVTLLTVQNTQTVSMIQPLTSEWVVEQLRAVIGDIAPQAAKTGALGNAELIASIGEQASSFSFPLVVDPVMVSKHGHSLIDDDAVETFVSKLLPKAFLVTPNMAEASRLSGIPVVDVASMEKSCSIIADFGVPNVLVKGGILDGNSVDVLYSERQVYVFPMRRVETKHTHGTGCVLSAAITARLARGEGLLEAVSGAKAFVHEAIRTCPNLGHGLGPINLFSGPKGSSID